MKKVWFCLAFVFSVLVFNVAFVSADVAPNFNSFNFPSSPYAQNGPGAKGPYCTNPVDPKCGSTGPWDIGSVSVTQDFNYLAWQFFSPNMSQARFCNPTSNNVTISVEFDADSNSTSGCTGNCYPGSDYRVLINQTGGGQLLYYNLSSPLSFITNFSVPVFVNMTACSVPTQLKLAVNKSYIKNLRGLMFQVEVKDPSISLPLDVLGTFGGDNMNFNNSNFDPLFRPFGCGQYAHTNASACVNNTNGDSCKWDTDFNDCFPDFFGGGGGFGGSGMSCSSFCGVCRNSTDCNTNQRCQWNGNMPNPMTGSTGACMEDPSKIITIPGMGSCDQDCHNCLTNFSCATSRVQDPRGIGGAGCTWINDSLFNKQWCEPSTYILQNCSASNPERCTSNATCGNANGAIWDNINNFCYIAGTEICFNGVDDNGDGRVDCSDQACGISPNCGGGIDTLTGGFGTADPMEALKQRMMGGMISPPTHIGDAANNATTLPVNYSVLDITGFSIADMGNAIGMGIEVRSMAPSAFCLAGAGNKTPSTYYYLIDVDSNATTGCNANISRSLSQGYEYELVYQIGWNGTNYTEIRKGYRCIPSSGNFSLFPAQLTGPPEPPTSTGPNSIQCNEANAAIIAIAKTDLGNPKSRIRFSVASADSTTNRSIANDSLTDLYYKPGTIDFKPTDCFSNPTACGSRFSIIGGGKFMPFQDCLSSTDTDGNGYSGCADPMCVNFPRCVGASNRYNTSNDKDAPSVVSNRAETYADFAFLHWITDEPSNGTIRFYDRSSTCTGTINVSRVDAPPFEADRYRPFHGMPMDSFSLGFTLSSSTTYYYKLYSCDSAGNCGLSSCLNFTMKGVSESRTVQFKFDFTPPNETLLRSTSMKIINASGVEVNISASTLQNLSSFMTNATLRFENSNTSSPWKIELEGIDLAKTLSINLTGAFNATNTTNSTMYYIGMSGSKWQEMAQNLGADSIKVTIPVGGNALIKCDESNISNCQDVTSQATLLEGGTGYLNTTWRIPTSLGFSVYGTTIGGVTVASDKTTYKCYPTCTTYVNVSNNNATAAGTFNLTINNTYTGSGITFTISYYNETNGTWVSSSRTNDTLFADFNFTNDTARQFRIDISMASPFATIWTFNATISNVTIPLSRSFTDISYLDAINLTTANNSLTTNQTPPLRFKLYALNDTSQNCTAHINGSDYTNTSSTNGSVTTIFTNVSITNGTYTWNVSCTSSETSETGFSETRIMQINTTAPVIFSISFGSPTSSSATITWITNQASNSSVGYGTTASLGTTAGNSSFDTAHTVTLSSLSASTTYYYNVTSCDTLGNCVTNGTNTFATGSSGGGSSSSSSGGGGGTTTATAKESFAGFNIAADSTATKTLTSTAIGFTSIAITAKNAVTNVDLSIEKLASKPSTAETPAGKIYQYIQLTTTIKEADASLIKIKFRVEKSWLTSSGVNEDDVVLMRLADKWSELKTTKTGSDGTYVSYEADSPGFSNYAIGQKAAALSPASNATTPVPEETAETPTAPPQTPAVTPPATPPQREQEKKEGATEKIKELAQNKALMYITVAIFIVALVVIYFIIRKKASMGKAGKEKPLF